MALDPGKRSTGRRDLLRFLIAYLLASAAAELGVLGVGAIQNVIGGLGAGTLSDLVDGAMFFSVFALGFTLVFGAIGWAILLIWKCESWLAYAAVGAVLGLVAAAVDSPEGLSRGSPLLYSFPVAGALAAVTFWRVFFLPRSVRSDDEG